MLQAKSTYSVAALFLTSLPSFMVASAHPVDLLVHLSPEERDIVIDFVTLSTEYHFIKLSEGLLSNSSHGKARR